MNKTINIIFALCLTTLLIPSALAEKVPSPSKQDHRIRYIDYDANNVSRIVTSYGFVTAIIFAEDEDIIDTTAGFAEGWDINIANSTNIVYIKPLPIRHSEGVIVPEAKEWRTNITVKTNRRFYVFEVGMVEPEKKQSYYAVNFNYPLDEQQRQDALEAKRDRETELGAIENALTQQVIPKNWEFTAKVNAGSELIMPDYVYDDGTNTHLGFARSKQIPSIFILENEEEILTNFSVHQHNNEYVEVVVHHITPIFILRNGSQVIGIFNKGFGKQEYRYEDATSPDVERVLR